jgi:uncharacterized protein
MTVAGLAPEALAFALAVIVVGGFVRGYTGFGASMIWVAGLTLVMPPAAAVPVILMLEVAASAHLLPQVWRDIDWHSLKPLVVGASVATPLGVYALLVVPAATMQVAIALVVLAAVAMLWRGVVLERAPDRAATLGVGALSGVINGATSAGGPPVIAFYFATPVGVTVGRASIIAYFLATDALAAGLAAAGGLVDLDSLIRFAIFLPATLLGTALGARRFLGADPERFRRLALILLAVLAAAALLQAIAA